MRLEGRKSQNETTHADAFECGGAGGNPDANGLFGVAEGRGGDGEQFLSPSRVFRAVSSSAGWVKMTPPRWRKPIDQLEPHC
jgi:hypothetical protein